MERWSGLSETLIHFYSPTGSRHCKVSLLMLKMCCARSPTSQTAHTHQRAWAWGAMETTSSQVGLASFSQGKHFLFSLDRHETELPSSGPSL